MSKLMIVVEARPKGGSMHQIELALKRGKTALIFEPKPNVKRYKEYYRAYTGYISKGAKRGTHNRSVQKSTRLMKR